MSQVVDPPIRVLDFAGHTINRDFAQQARVTCRYQLAFTGPMAVHSLTVVERRTAVCGAREGVPNDECGVSVS
jgi:hypothetical protein